MGTAPAARTNGFRDKLLKRFWDEQTRRQLLERLELKTIPGARLGDFY